MIPPEITQLVVSFVGASGRTPIFEQAPLAPAIQARNSAPNGTDSFFTKPSKQNIS
jgi:hypothetical protein